MCGVLLFLKVHVNELSRLDYVREEGNFILCGKGGGQELITSGGGRH